MSLSLIAAVGQNNGIGFQGKIPWHLSSDFKRFKKLTTGHSVIMGQNTYLSLGRPLPNRRNIVLSQDPNLSAPGCEIVNTFDQALALIQNETEVFVIGGGQVYASTINQADKLYITWVHTEPAADVFFPKISADLWDKIYEEDFPADDQNDYSSTYVIYNRR